MREAALSSLRAFLAARQTSSSLSTLEILKLWMGLYYALWMADRAVPQQNLCNDLAALLSVFDRDDNAAAIAWLRGFWATMARKWTEIDVLRMEKFLLLVRRVLGASLAWMKADVAGGEGKWDAGRVDSMLDLLAEWPFSLQSGRQSNSAGDDGGSRGGEDEDLMPKTVPAGLRVHVLDIWVDEAEKLGMLDDDDTVGHEILKRINDLVAALQKATTTTSVRKRSQDSLDDERLPWNAKDAGIEGQGGEDEDMADDASWDGFND